MLREYLYPSMTKHRHLFKLLGAVTITTPVIFTLSEKSSSSFPSESERQQIFSSIASNYDGMVRWTEFSTGISRWRKLLVSQCHGDVLEIGIGTGRNFQYYRGDKVKSLTGLDFSRRVLEIAKNKSSSRLDKSVSLKLVCGDVASPELLADKKFDCIVDTFGICSFEDPVIVLKRLKGLLKDSNSKLFLLEHGNTKYSYINNYLHKNLYSHVNKFGCYHNRDIVEIVNSAGYKIIEYKEKHFGSLKFLVCQVDNELDP
jgi:methyltransferase OMS1, mitochondrial